MNLQDLSLEQLKEIVDGAPFAIQKYVWQWWNPDESIYEVATHAAIVPQHWIKLSDLRARIAELEPVFKVGDWVVPESEATNLIRAVREVLEVDGDQIRYHMEAQVRSYWSKAKGWRHATPEEIAAGYRIDEPSSSCGMTAVEIDQFGEDLRKKPYVDFLEFEQPDTITTQLDPAKCRVVDPTVYDEPAKRRVGWVGCLGFGAIGDALQGNRDCLQCGKTFTRQEVNVAWKAFAHTSESHRSPGCKCHEFPFDAELKVPAGQKHDQGKPRYSLIPSSALASIVDVLEYGATKYAPDNWKHVENARERYYNASMRHVQAWWSGEQVDSESGLPHLAHAICSLMFLMTLDGEQGE